jgi:hypothetical protein
VPADECAFFFGNGNANHHIETDVIVHKGIISAYKRVEFVSDRMSYITLRGRWCDIVLNVHTPNENEGDDDTKGNFYEKAEPVFDHIPTYNMQILL